MRGTRVKGTDGTARALIHTDSAAPYTVTFVSVENLIRGVDGGAPAHVRFCL